MKFWQIVFDLFFTFMIPYKVHRILHKGEKVRITFVYVLPWAQAFTVGNNIYTTIKPEKWFKERSDIQANELSHVDDWREEGFFHPFNYLKAWLIALIKTGNGYRNNKYEVKSNRAQILERRRKDKNP